MTRADDIPQEKLGKDPLRTFLYIKCNARDTGNQVPASEPAWLSPSIEIITPTGSRGDAVVPNQLNHIEVTVANGGEVEAVDAYVDVFAADPVTAFTSAVATPIGGTYISVPAYGSRSTTLAWTPPSTFAGPVCLLARVALYMPPDTYDGPTDFDTRRDRHIAQRGLVVLRVADARNIYAKFLVPNTLTTSGVVELTANEPDDHGYWADMQAVLSGMRLVPPARPYRSVKLGLVGGARGTQDVRAPAGIVRLTPLRTGEFPDEALATGSASATLQPGEVGQGVLYVKPATIPRRGEMHAVDVRQVEGGTVVGGLTIVFVH